MRGGDVDDYTDRQYRMRRPLISRLEHEAKVRELEGRIEELERELREWRRRDQTRRRGW